jgi:hypothetical protein
MPVLGHDQSEFTLNATWSGPVRACMWHQCSVNTLTPAAAAALYTQYTVIIDTITKRWRQHCPKQSSVQGIACRQCGIMIYTRRALPGSGPDKFLQESEIHGFKETVTSAGVRVRGTGLPGPVHITEPLCAGPGAGPGHGHSGGPACLPGLWQQARDLKLASEGHSRVARRRVKFEIDSDSDSESDLGLSETRPAARALKQGGAGFPSSSPGVRPLASLSAASAGAAARPGAFESPVQIVVLT